jgi:hypothetical protein
MNLAGNYKVIHGAQELRGKILSRKDLASVGQSVPSPLSPWLSSAVLIPSAVIEITSVVFFSPFKR